jgi:hypothetical protein
MSPQEQPSSAAEYRQVEPAGRSAETVDDSLRQLLAELRYVMGQAQHLLYRMDGAVSALESTTEAWKIPANPAPVVAEEVPSKARRQFISTMRGSYLQIIFGLAIGIAALLAAFYLFVGSR